MLKRLVDVFDRDGRRLFTYSIALEDGRCLDAEFEEVALILAESSGLVAASDVVHLRACCEPCADEPEMMAEAKPKPRAKTKSTVLSMVRHRMKKAGLAPATSRARQVS